MDYHPIQVASCYRKGDKLRLDGTLGSNADFTLAIITKGISLHLEKSSFTICPANNFLLPWSEFCTIK